MGYNRWSYLERLKWILLGNIGKLILSFFAFAILVQFPEATSYIAQKIRWAINLLTDVISKNIGFLSGVLVTVTIGYFKDRIYLSKQTRSAGRALRSEVSSLMYSAKWHLEKLEKWETYETPHEQRQQELRYALKRGDKIDYPTPLFKGDKQIHFFQANASLISQLHVPYVLQGDDIVRLSSQINDFIKNYASLYSKLQKVEEETRILLSLYEPEQCEKIKDAVYAYSNELSEYKKSIKWFRDQCSTLADVLRRM